MRYRVDLENVRVQESLLLAYPFCKQKRKKTKAAISKDCGWASDMGKPYKSLGSPDLALEFPLIHKKAKVMGPTSNAAAFLLHNLGEHAHDSSQYPMLKYEDTSKVRVLSGYKLMAPDQMILHLQKDKIFS